MQLERAHRVGRRDNYRHRAIIGSYSKYGDGEAVMRNFTKLRGTKIYINEDLCPASKIRKPQPLLLKPTKSEDKGADFRYTKLIIK